jgi:hypothetical protein
LEIACDTSDKGVDGDSNVRMEETIRDGTSGRTTLLSGLDRIFGAATNHASRWVRIDS